MPTPIQARALFDPLIMRRAIIDAFTKLDPRHQARNPVMHDDEPWDDAWLPWQSNGPD